MISGSREQIIETATNLYNNDLTPLPCHYNEKRPVGNSWNMTSYLNVDDVINAFSNKTYNIGLLLDHETVAIDLDAINISNKIGIGVLAHCGIGVDRNVIGRTKKPCGKIILKSNKAIDSVRHRVIDENGKTIIELLGYKHNVIMPPSVVDNTDQFRAWNEFYSEMHYHDEAEIKTAMNYVALWSMLSDNYPEESTRDEAVRCLVTLFKASDHSFIDANFVNFFTGSLAETNNDQERVRKNWTKFYEKTAKTKRPLKVFEKNFPNLPEFVQKFMIETLGLNAKKSLKISTLQDVMGMTFEKPKFLINAMFPIGLG